MLAIGDALHLALEKGLDLVEVSPTANPPVCRLMDFGRYKFQQEKKKAEAKKNQSVIHLKEIKMRPSTGQHDFDFKLRHITRFLEAGDRVKVTIRFRGREMVHQDRGYTLLKRVAAELEEVAIVETQPKMEGRQLFAMLVPKASRT